MRGQKSDAYLIFLDTNPPTICYSKPVFIERVRVFSPMFDDIDPKSAMLSSEVVIVTVLTLISARRCNCFKCLAVMVCKK